MHENVVSRYVGGTYVETSPAGVLPVASFSQASPHSRMTSMAYLKTLN